MESQSFINVECENGTYYIGHFSKILRVIIQSSKVLNLQVINNNFKTFQPISLFELKETPNKHQWKK